MFVRFQSPIPGKRGVHTGVFGLTNLLGRAGHLTPDEHAAWRAGNDWYNAAYPDPTDTDPSVYDETVHPRATAWFKETAAHLLERVPPYLEILGAHGVECVRVESEDPGRVIYEDDVQIVVDPYDPAAPTSIHPAS
ncbi:hypothetical protein ACQFYA_20550 [Promicromonospora sp. Marseille-Q5078]